MVNVNAEVRSTKKVNNNIYTHTPIITVVIIVLFLYVSICVPCELYNDTYNQGSLSYAASPAT